MLQWLLFRDIMNTWQEHAVVWIWMPFQILRLGNNDCYEWHSGKYFRKREKSAWRMNGYSGILAKQRLRQTAGKWELPHTVTIQIWRDIEVVITRRSWKPFVRKGAWVRIPLSPLFLWRENFQRVESLEMLFPIQQNKYKMCKLCYRLDSIRSSF